MSKVNKVKNIVKNDIIYDFNLNQYVMDFILKNKNIILDRNDLCLIDYIPLQELIYLDINNNNSNIANLNLKFKGKWNMKKATVHSGVTISFILNTNSDTITNKDDNDWDWENIPFNINFNLMHILNNPNGFNNKPWNPIILRESGFLKKIFTIVNNKNFDDRNDLYHFFYNKNKKLNKKWINRCPGYLNWNSLNKKIVSDMDFKWISARLFLPYDLFKNKKYWIYDWDKEAVLSNRTINIEDYLFFIKSNPQWKLDNLSSESKNVILKYNPPLFFRYYIVYPIDDFKF